MSFLYWIVLGLIMGIIENFITPGSKDTIVKSITLSIICALVAGYLLNLLGFGVTDFDLTSLALSAVVIVFITVVSRMVKRG